MSQRDLRRYYLFRAVISTVLLVVMPAILLVLAGAKIDEFKPWFLFAIESVLFVATCYYGYRYWKIPPGVAVPAIYDGEVSEEEVLKRYQLHSRKEAILAVCVSAPLAVICVSNWKAMALVSGLFALGLGGLIDPQVSYALRVRQAPFHKKILASLLILGGMAFGLYLKTFLGR